MQGVAGPDSEKDAMRAEIDRLKAQIQDQKQQLTSAGLGRRVINKQNLEIGNKEDSK